MNEKEENQHKIDRLITAMRIYAFGDIKKVMVGDNVLASFILCCCFIEQMATFRYGREVGKAEFEGFVAQYLQSYDPCQLRKDLRNRLVHNYSLGQTYSLVQRFSQLHLHQTGGTIMINLENFIDDLEGALNGLLKEFNKEGKVRDNALEALRKIDVVSGQSMTAEVKD